LNKELYELRCFVSGLANNTGSDYPIKAVISRAKNIRDKFKILHHSELKEVG